MIPQEDAVTDGFSAPVEGRREHKKKQTLRALHVAALDLVTRHGTANVSTDDIARAAGVSPRTFFNYFPTKEAALTGLSPDLGFRLAETIREQPPGVDEHAICTHIASHLVRIATDDTEVWHTRRQLLRERPELTSGAAGQRQTTLALIEALRDRMGDAGRAKWQAPMLAMATMDAMRVCLATCQTQDEALAMVEEIMAALAPAFD